MDGYKGEDKEDMMESTENTARARAYEILAGFFSNEPTREMFDFLNEAISCSIEDTIEGIEVDFATMFIVPGNGLQPFESLYNRAPDEEPSLWGKATKDVAGFYRAYGVHIDESTGILPDHISVELGFMGHLIEREDNNAQRRFLEEHLLKWIPEFCDRVYSKANTDFYKGVSKLTKEFILSEYEAIKGEAR